MREWSLASAYRPQSKKSLDHIVHGRPSCATPLEKLKLRHVDCDALLGEECAGLCGEAHLQMAAVRNNMTRAVEMRTCLCDKSMRLAKNITRLKIDKLALINLAILLLLTLAILLLITLDLLLLLLLIVINRLCGARMLPFRENAVWSQCECFEHVLRSEVQAMCHASAKPHIEHP